MENENMSKNIALNKIDQTLMLAAVCIRNCFVSIYVVSNYDFTLHYEQSILPIMNTHPTNREIKQQHILCNISPEFDVPYNNTKNSTNTATNNNKNCFVLNVMFINSARFLYSFSVFL